MREKPERKFSGTKLKNKSPLSENPGTLKSTKSGKDDIAVVSGGKSRESIIDLEWDDNGIQLDTDVFADELWMNPGHVFQNSILRYFFLKFQFRVAILIAYNLIYSEKKIRHFSVM